MYLFKSSLCALNWPKDGGQWPTQSSIQFQMYLPKLQNAFVNVKKCICSNLHYAHLIDQKMAGNGQRSYIFNSQLFRCWLPNAVICSIPNVFAKIAKFICQRYNMYLCNSLLRTLNWPKDGRQQPVQSSIQFLNWIQLFRC